MSKFLVAFSFILQLGALSASEPPVSVTSQSELGHYWTIDRKKMPNTMPINISEVIRRYKGEVVFDIEYLIDETGKPSGFKLNGTIPESASLEFERVRAYYLFLRYKSVVQPPKPVLFKGKVRWWDPELKNN